MEIPTTSEKDYFLSVITVSPAQAEAFKSAAERLVSDGRFVMVEHIHPGRDTGIVRAAELYGAETSRPDARFNEVEQVQRVVSAIDRLSDGQHILGIRVPASDYRLPGDLFAMVNRVEAPTQPLPTVIRAS